MSIFVYDKNNPLIKVLIINTAVFILMLFIQLVSFLFTGNSQVFLNPVVHFLAVPASLKKLLFHFWSPITYMFLHTDFWHFFFNMLWLYFGGLMFVMYIDSRKLIPLYILGGLSGAVLFILSYNIFPVFLPVRQGSYALGASASITAIIIAIAVYQPLTDVYLFGVFRMKLFWIAIFFVIWDLFSIMGDNAGGHIAHLGGAIFGYFFAYYLKRGKDITSILQNFNFKTSHRKKYHFNMRTSNDKEYNENVHQIRKELDRILEKISKHGYKRLSKKEREFLNKYKDYF